MFFVGQHLAAPKLCWQKLTMWHSASNPRPWKKSPTFQLSFKGTSSYLGDHEVQEVPVQIHLMTKETGVLGNIYSANCMAQKRAMLCQHSLLRHWAMYVTYLVVQGDLGVLLAHVNLPALNKRKTQTRENRCYGVTAAMETVNILLLEALTIKGGLRWDLGDPRWSRGRRGEMCLVRTWSKI